MILPNSCTCACLCSNQSSIEFGLDSGSLKVSAFTPIDVSVLIVVEVVFELGASLTGLKKESCDLVVVASFISASFDPI